MAERVTTNKWCLVRTAGLVLAGLAGWAAGAHAQAVRAAAQPGQQLTVYLATFGQGSQVWERFGHNAIWIRDAGSGTTTSYNYGMFSFGEPGFVRRFAQGRMLYWMGVHHGDAELAAYQQSNRSVWVQRLNLTPAQRHALRDFLDWNWLPENSRYLYHPFNDNCSTRVRDALDRVLDGALRSQLAGKETGTTYRWHSLRLTGSNPLVHTGLSLALAMPTDRPIDAWEEGFIPMQLMRHVRDVRVTGPDGRPVPLVLEEQTMFEADRPPEASEPPSRWPAHLLVGVLLAGGMLFLARGARARKRTALRLGIALSAWGTVAGFFGVILTFLWVATDHTATYGNQNLLQVNPLSLVLAVAGPLAVVRPGSARAQRAWRLAWRTSSVLVVLSVAGLLLRMFPSVGQVNGPIIALALPLHLASVLSLRQAYGPGTSYREDVSSREPTVRAA